MKTEHKHYTLEIYKADKRRKAGEFLWEAYEYGEQEVNWMKEEIAILTRTLYKAPAWRLELHETYVTKKNLLSGEEYQERYDTPIHCSPSSESYWSM